MSFPDNDLSVHGKITIFIDGYRLRFHQISNINEFQTNKISIENF